jgi:hypothetical protein
MPTPGDGSADCGWISATAAERLKDLYRAGSFSNLRSCHRAGTVDDHGTLARVEDRGFNAMGGGPGVEHGIDAAVQVFEHVAAVVGLMWPKILALGAATGTPARRISSSATGWAGMRTPTRGRPAVTASGTALVRGSRSVSGPGQKAAINLRAGWGIS